MRCAIAPAAPSLTPRLAPCQAILLLVYNVSYSVALYALVRLPILLVPHPRAPVSQLLTARAWLALQLLFYIATSEQLSAFHPVWKFFAVRHGTGPRMVVQDPVPRVYPALYAHACRAYMPLPHAR